MFKNQRILTRIPVNEKIALAEGMIPLLEDGLRKVENGETTKSELLRSVSGMSIGDTAG